MTHTATRAGPDDGQALSVETIEDERMVRVVLRGECDFSLVQLLDQRLPELRPDTALLVRLDLTRLAFADTATIRALAIFAREARRTGHDVQTRGAHPTMAKVASLLHVQHDLGLT